MHEFLNTPEALYLGAHVISGKALSLSALAENVTTLAVGLTCTAISQSSNPKLQALSENISAASKKFFSKKTPLLELEASKNFTGKDLTKLKETSKKDEGKPESKKSAEPDWWHDLSDDAQAKYLKDHPGSDYKKTQKKK